MPLLNEIVDVEITRESRGITQVGFNTPLIMTTHTRFAEAARRYSTLQGMLDDGFLVTDAAYKAARSLLTQENAPDEFIIGKLTGAAIDIDLAAVNAVQPDWYALIHETRVAATIALVAAFIETQEKIYVACTSDAAVLAGTAGNAALALQALSYDRTALIYSGDQANFPDAAWVGSRLAYDPGSATWKFPTLKGITADNLTVTQSANVRNAKGNTYEVFAGRSIVREGTVGGGEFLDITIGIDYLTQRIRENVFSALANALKIPYTDAGVAVIQNLLNQSLADGVNKSILASYVITVPKVADVSTANRAARLLPDVNFTGVLAGAIHKVEIHGRVSV